MGGKIYLLAKFARKQKGQAGKVLVSKEATQDSQVLKMSGYSNRNKVCEMWMSVQNWNINKSLKIITWDFELLKI